MSGTPGEERAVPGRAAATGIDGGGPSRPPRRGRPRDETLSARRREEILRAATGVFAARGYERTEVQAIADAAGCGKGTIYRYFSCKRELFLAAADRGMVLLRQAVDRAIAETADELDRVVLAVQSYLEFFDRRPELVELIIQERARFRGRSEPTYFQHRDRGVVRWRKLFRDLIAAGRVREMSVDRITDTLSDLVYGTMFTNFFAGRRKSSARQARDILDVVFRGILTPSERRRWRRRQRTR